MKILVLCLWCVFMCSVVQGQTVEIRHFFQDSLFICGEARLNIQLKNRSGSLLLGAVLSSEFPTGIEYQKGSILQASELNIAQLHQPEFMIDSLFPGQTITLQLKIHVTCDLFQQVNAGKLFQNFYSLTHLLGRDTLRTEPPYPIETGFLVITPVRDTFEEAGNTLQRKIQLTNTRLGPIRQLLFEDRHDSILISGSPGQVRLMDFKNLQLMLDATQFLQIGDRDSLLEHGESVWITEVISDSFCIPKTILSNFSAGWGCNGMICQQDKDAASVQILLPIGEAQLQFITDVKPESCPCIPEGHAFEMEIQNIGNRRADSIIIDLFSEYPVAGSELSGFLTDSFRIVGQAAINFIKVIDSAQANFCESISRSEALQIGISPLEPGQRILLYGRIGLTREYNANQLNYFYKYRYITSCRNTVTQRLTPVEKALILNDLQAPQHFLRLNTNNNVLKGNFTLIDSIKIQKALLKETLHVRWVIPCGIRLLDSSFVLGGKRPVDIQIERSQATIIHLQYLPPFDSKSFLLSAAFELDCNAQCLEELLVNSQRFITQCKENKSDTVSLSGLICSQVSFNCYEHNTCSCGPVSNSLFGFAVDCSNSTVQWDSISAFVDFTSKVYRANVYEEDQNGDRLSDGTGKADTSDIQNQRFITNDTLLNIVEGRVISENPEYKMDSVAFLLSHTLALQPLKATLHYFQAHSGRWFDLTMDSFALKYGSGGGNIVCGQIGLKRESYGSGWAVPFTLKQLQKQFPSDTFSSFAGEDRFLLEAFYRFTGNVNDRIYNASVSNFVQLFSRNNQFLIPYSCHEETHMLSFASLGLNVMLPSREMMYCKQQLFTEPLVLQGNKTLADFFSNEFRSLIKIDSIKYLLPNGISLDTLWIKTFYHDGNQFRQVDRSFVLPIRKGNVYFFDSNALAFFRWDESHRLEFLPHFSVSRCEYLKQGEVPISFQYSISAIDSNLYWVFPDVQTLYHKSLITSGILYTINNPGDALEFHQNELYISSKIIQWDLLYPANTAGGYLKFELESALGRVSGFQLAAQPATPIQEIRQGCFLAGPLDKQTNYIFNMQGVEEACMNDTLLVIGSWSCDEHSLRSGQDSCLKTYLRIPVVPASPELEMHIQESNDLQHLCDTLREVKIELFNANKGAAFKPSLTIQIPRGISLLPGSLWISYPEGTPEKPLPLPKPLNADTYIWEFEQLFPGIAKSGLPGVQFQPFNKIVIRFRAWLDCDFIPGQYFVFTAAGINNCNELTNTLRKAGNAINIEGITAQTAPKIKMEIQSPNDCHQKLTNVRLTIWPQQTSGPEDSCLVRFPVPLSYRMNSFVPLRNIPLQTPDVFSFSGYGEVRIKLPEGVSKDSAILFSIDLEGWPALSCGKYPVGFEAYSRGKAICLLTQAPCIVKTSSSSVWDTLDKQLTNVRLSNWSLNHKDATTIESNFSFQVDQLKRFTEDSLCFGVYSDRAIVGRLDATDDLVGLYKIKVEPGQDTLNGVVDFSFKSPVNWTCQYILVPLNEACICNTDTLFKRLPEVQNTILQDSICPEDSILLTEGIDSTQFFKWIRSPGSCDSCFHQSYHHTSGVPGMDTFQLQIVSSDSCLHNIFFRIVRNPLPASTFMALERCPDELVELNAGHHTQFYWEGEEILDPKLYVQKIKLTEPRRYLLFFTEPNGCKGIDTFDLYYIEDSGRFHINPDTIIRQGDPAQLYTNPGFHYEWVPDADLDCSDCHNPVATPEKTTRYYLTLTDSAGCKHLFSVLVRVLTTDCEQALPAIPNAFSPNGDQLNDHFQILGNIPFDRFQLIIVDRWGETVFRSTDPYQPWDGRYKNKTLPPDVYGYLLQYDCNGRLVTHKGNVSLLK